VPVTHERTLGLRSRQQAATQWHRNGNVHGVPSVMAAKPVNGKERPTRYLSHSASGSGHCGRPSSSNAATSGQAGSFTQTVKQCECGRLQAELSARIIVEVPRTARSHRAWCSVGSTCGRTRFRFFSRTQMASLSATPFAQSARIYCSQPLCGGLAPRPPLQSSNPGPPSRTS